MIIEAAFLLDVVSFFELIDTSACIHKFLSACEEGVALGADLDPDFGLGGTGFDDIAAGAADHRGTILGMDTVFHCFHLFRVPPPGDEDAHHPMAAG